MSNRSMADETPPPNPLEPVDPREKVKTFPTSPGVYLMKDERGRVIYIGKAVNLRNRAGSYFSSQAAVDLRTRNLVPEIKDLDFIITDSEVDALLLEARLIKDVQPRFNQELKDDKTFPYLEIFIREEFPRVEFTRKPRPRGTKLYGPFTNAKRLRGAIAVLQQIFQFRTCTLDIKEADDRWRWFRPCLLASIRQCTAPCNMRISREDYRRDIRRLRMFLDGKKESLFRELRAEMMLASKEMKFEKAARLRDQIKSLENLNLRGDLREHAQPEVFQVDPRRGLLGLKKIFELPTLPRRIEGMDIAHLQGGETVASCVQFIDGLPFKHGYKRFKIRSVDGVDDFASMREVVSRHFGDCNRRANRSPISCSSTAAKVNSRPRWRRSKASTSRHPLCARWPNGKKKSSCPGNPIRRSWANIPSRCGCCSTSAMSHTVSLSSIITC